MSNTLDESLGDWPFALIFGGDMTGSTIHKRNADQSEMLAVNQRSTNNANFAGKQLVVWAADVPAVGQICRVFNAQSGRFD